MERIEKQQIKVAEITASWGSPLQKQAGEAALHALLLAWQEFYSEKHQRNHINIAFTPSRSSRSAHEMEARQNWCGSEAVRTGISQGLSFSRLFSAV